jgi:hypothetical protein
VASHLLDHALHLARVVNLCSERLLTTMAQEITSNRKSCNSLANWRACTTSPALQLELRPPRAKANEAAAEGLHDNQITPSLVRSALRPSKDGARSGITPRSNSAIRLMIPAGRWDVYRRARAAGATLPISMPQTEAAMIQSAGALHAVSSAGLRRRARSL